MQEIELYENEQILQSYKGMYWEKSFMFLYEQNVGEIIITNMRIIFISKVFSKQLTLLNLNISDIQNIQKCGVGEVIPLNPTGIKITMKDSTIYKISSYHRNKIMETISNMI